jgi:hypothetical protein
MAQPKAPKGYIPVNVEGDVEVYIYQPTDPRIKSPSWYLYYYYNKKIQRQSLKTKNQKAAHRLARETAEKLSSGQGALLQQVRANRDATFAHLVERTLTEYPKWTDTTKIRIEAQMKIVVGFFGEDRPVQQITTPVVQEFLGWLRAHGGRRHKDRKRANSPAPAAATKPTTATRATSRPSSSSASAAAIIRSTPLN